VAANMEREREVGTAMNEEEERESGKTGETIKK